MHGSLTERYLFFNLIQPEVFELKITPKLPKKLRSPIGDFFEGLPRQNDCVSTFGDPKNTPTKKSSKSSICNGILGPPRLGPADCSCESMVN